EAHLGLRGRAEGAPPPGRRDRRLDDLGASVPEEQRAPRLDVVHVATAIDVLDERTLAARQESRRAANCSIRAHRRVHPTGSARERAREQLLRAPHAHLAVLFLRSATWRVAYGAQYAASGAAGHP